MVQAAIAALVVAIQLPVGGVVATGSGSPEPRGDASADFNGDGYHDLAIGAPNEDIGSATDAGAVNVLYGGPTGLGTAGNQIWTQDSPGIHGTAEAYDWFG